MSLPRVHPPRTIDADTIMLGAELPVPGLGVLAANAFVIRGERPVLVDAGVLALSEAFLNELRQVVALESIAAIFLTHTDPDHIGMVEAILAAAPQAKIATNFLGMGKLGLRSPIAKERVFLVNPGQTRTLGGRSLLAVAPPAYDAPESMAWFDPCTKNLFSADCFGAVLPALTASVDELSEQHLRQGMAVWTQVDAPWIRDTEEQAFRRGTAGLRALEPACVLGSHLPPAPRGFERLVSCLEEAKKAAPFVGPDEAAALRASLEG